MIVSIRIGFRLSLMIACVLSALVCFSESGVDGRQIRSARDAVKMQYGIH